MYTTVCRYPVTGRLWKNVWRLGFVVCMLSRRQYVQRFWRFWPHMTSAKKSSVFGGFWSDCSDHLGFHGSLSHPGLGGSSNSFCAAGSGDLAAGTSSHQWSPNFYSLDHARKASKSGFGSGQECSDIAAHGFTFGNDCRCAWACLFLFDADSSRIIRWFQGNGLFCMLLWLCASPFHSSITCLEWPEGS